MLNTSTARDEKWQERELKPRLEEGNLEQDRLVHTKRLERVATGVQKGIIITRLAVTRINIMENAPLDDITRVIVQNINADASDN